jgi:HlyD family secretion protein
MIGDLTQYHVRADVDEHDIPRFQPAARARAFQRGDPQNELKLKLVRVERYVTPRKSLTGVNTERVDMRVLQAIYAIEGQCPPVYVGQQVDVFIDAIPKEASRKVLDAFFSSVAAVTKGRPASLSFCRWPNPRE